MPVALSASRRLRIAQVVGPFEPVPPEAYGGTERVVEALVRRLVARGHQVTTFASGDSSIPGEHVATVEEALRPAGFGGDPVGYTLETAFQALDRAGDFDVIHSHLEWIGIFMGRATPTPLVHTFHGRLDHPWAHALLSGANARLVAISEHQASAQPDVDLTVVHNGLDLDALPWRSEAGDDLCYVGRMNPEKGILDAIEVATRTNRHLRIAAKIGTQAFEIDFYENKVRPAIAKADVEFLGELGTEDRARLVSESYASLVTGVWPEPFGLVVIESLACGTPVIGRRVGALPEIIREGVDGFFGDDIDHLVFQVERVATLDRAAIRESVVSRFSADRMADAYEALYLDAASTRPS